MKRTTYILAGVLLAGLVAIGGIMFYVSTCGTNWEDSIMEIDGEQKTVQLPECKVVQLFMVPSATKEVKKGLIEVERMISFEEVSLLVQPTDSIKGNFSFAQGMEQFMSLNSSGDTLRIVFDFPEMKLDAKFKELRWIKLRSKEMALNIPASVQLVACNVYNMKTTFKGFHQDSLSISTDGTAVVEDSHLASLNAKTRNLFLTSGEVRNLYLDLDYVSQWQVNAETFNIDTEHLSGSREHRNELQKDECRQVLWTPKSENASLNLKLNQATKVEIK